MAELLAVGVDGARGGWLAASAFGSGEVVEHVTLQLVGAFEQLDGLRGGEAVPVAVDVPMGLLETVGLRRCDQLARDALGPRRSSVFTPPSRPLLAATTYGEARALIEQERLQTPEAMGLSAQAFGIAPKIREADEYLLIHPGAQDWLWECHPELSFQGLAQVDLPSKTSVAGQLRRLALMRERFPAVEATLLAFEPGGTAANLDDALDALACLHTALALRSGTPAYGFGDISDPRDVDARGLVMRVVG